MRRRLNYTGRIRIRQSDIEVEVRSEEDRPLTFRAERSLHSYELPPDATVYLEAYRGPSYMRFNWGTVAEQLTLGPGIRLSNIDSNDTVYFRVKVVDGKTADGLILAHADRIRANVSQQSLLPVESKNLGDIVWRLSFDDDEPFLIVNSQIDGILEWVRSDPSFAALVFPTALRSVLERLCEEATAGDDESLSWVAGWERFARDLTGRPVPSPDALDRSEWIDDAVNSFSRKHTLLNRYQEALNAGS